MGRWALAAAVLGVVAVALWVLLGRAERAVLFPGSFASGLAGGLPPEGVRSVWLEHAGGRTEAWLLPSAREPQERGPLVLFAHGNAELIDHWAREFAPPRAWGLSVLLVEYPGYGRSSGRPSQASIGAAMAAAYDWGARQAGVDPQRIVAWGRSLGGGAACALADERPVAALVLESTFTSVRDMARGLSLPALRLQDPFDNLAAVRRFRGPILLLHGERDEIVAKTHAEALHAAAPASELHLLPCGHNDCRRPWPVVEEFLRAHGLR
jgi:pimeloyl-ACP methyl ester carboxylesterase